MREPGWDWAAASCVFSGSSLWFSWAQRFSRLRPGGRARHSRHGAPPQPHATSASAHLSLPLGSRLRGPRFPSGHLSTPQLTPRDPSLLLTQPSPRPTRPFGGLYFCPVPSQRRLLLTSCGFSSNLFIPYPVFVNNNNSSHRLLLTSICQ